MTGVFYPGNLIYSEAFMPCRGTGFKKFPFKQPAFNFEPLKPLPLPPNQKTSSK